MSPPNAIGWIDRGFAATMVEQLSSQVEMLDDDDLEDSKDP